MRPVLIDTNAYTEFKQGNKDVIEVMAYAEILAISPIVLGELLGGFDHGSKAKKNREELQLFLQTSRVKVFPVSADTANFYSHIYAALRAKGKPLPTNDLWISAQAMEHGCVLCSYDKHFKAIEGLISGGSLSELQL